LEPGNGPEHSGSGPFFASIHVLERLDRFTLQSKGRVDVQWKLFALVHNIGKIHQYELTQLRMAWRDGPIVPPTEAETLLSQ
jgi:hypothetical protein